MALEEWQEVFLKTLAKCGTVEQAVQAAGVHRATAYRHRKTDKQFAELWDQALESGTDILEAMAIKRAMEHSDALMLALLKARRPDVYKERQHIEHVRVDFRDAQEELERMARKLLEEDKEEQKPQELPPC